MKAYRNDGEVGVIEIRFSGTDLAFETTDDFFPISENDARRLQTMLNNHFANIPVCKACKDSHRMTIDDGDRIVMCTFCPVPCESCRQGPYCSKTPCGCKCHG